MAFETILRSALSTSHRARTIIYVLALLAIVLSTSGSFSQFSIGSLPYAVSVVRTASDPSISANAYDSLAIWSAIGVDIQLQPHLLPAVPDSAIDAETLWLARCIFSETKRPEEQELIAWVVRNRVESAFRGKSSYRDVVLDPFQFSAFNDESAEAGYYTSLALHHDEEGWQRALSIAYYVRHARPQYRPFSAETLHFYSEQSMVGRREPEWARSMTPIRPPERYRLDERRFRFFEGVS